MKRLCSRIPHVFPMHTVFIVFDIAAAFLFFCNRIELLAVDKCYVVIGKHILSSLFAL